MRVPKKVKRKPSFLSFSPSFPSFSLFRLLLCLKKILDRVIGLNKGPFPHFARHVDDFLCFANNMGGKVTRMLRGRLGSTEDAANGVNVPTTPGSPGSPKNRSRTSSASSTTKRNSIVSLFGFTQKGSFSDAEEAGVYVRLIPHEHTLFCERKSKVCEAVGKLQELEKLEVEVFGLSSAKGRWMRSKTCNPPSVPPPSPQSTSSPRPSSSPLTSSPLSSSSPMSLPSPKASLPASPVHPSSSRLAAFWDAFVPIEGSENSSRYTLTRHDVGHYVTFRPSGPEGDEYVPNIQGPVLPGPPRIMDNSVRIVNEKGYVDHIFQPGDVAFAVCNYVGGEQGPSEVWWMRVKDGVRENLTEPSGLTPHHIAATNGLAHSFDGKGCWRGRTAFPYAKNSTGSLSNGDPRIYCIQPKDLGWTLKVKCRPIRSDNYRGDIVTSKPTKPVAS